MAGFAGHVDLGVVGPELAGRGVEILDDIRRMAVRAMTRPVHRVSRPEEGVFRGHRFVGLQVVPALTGRGRARVPGDVERLQDTVARVQQVLLQGPVAERVPNGVCAAFSGASYGLDEMVVAVFEEPCVHTVERDPHVREIACHGGRRGREHGAEMVRALPGRRLGCVAGLAVCRADVVGGPGGHKSRANPRDGDGTPEATCAWPWGADAVDCEYGSRRSALLRRLRRQVAGDHPVDAELVRAHPEIGTPEGLLHRHRHRAAV